MLNSAAVDFLEMSRHELVNANTFSVNIARKNLQSSIQNARNMIDETDVTDRALANLLQEGNAFLEEIEKSLVPNATKIIKLREAVETALNAAVDVVGQAKSSATARALGL